MNGRTFIRAAVEAIDADQIDGDDPFFISDAELARAKRESAEIDRRNAEYNARRIARAHAKQWVVTVIDHGDGRSSAAA